jgi:hypothetical protein
MTRRRWVLLIVALAVAATVVGLVFDDGSDDWHGGGGLGGTPPPRRSPVDEEAMNAGRQQFERVYARCGMIHRAQRTVMKPIGGSRGGAGIATAVTELWEYRGITFEPRPAPLTQIEGFNKVTWHGDVIVSFEAVRGPGRGDMLWRAGEPIALPMQKRNGSWEPVQLLTALQQNERWSGRC